MIISHTAKIKHYFVGCEVIAAILSSILLQKSLIKLTTSKDHLRKICLGFSGQNLPLSLVTNCNKNIISTIAFHFRLIFVFHKNEKEFVRSKVCPPRLRGRKVGLFSTRSPHRPNPIGLSLAKLDRVDGIKITIDLYMDIGIRIKKISSLAEGFRSTLLPINPSLVRSGPKPLSNKGELIIKIKGEKS